MDNFRLILIIGLAMVSLMMYQEWQQDYGSTVTSKQNSPTIDSAGKEATVGNSSLDLELPQTPNSVKMSSVDLPSAQQRVLTSDSRIYIETDTLKVELDTKGGDVRAVDLVKYPIDVNKPENPFRLMNDKLPNLFVAQSGLLPKENAPTHQAIYTSTQKNYRLHDGSNQLEVILKWQNDQGIEVNKIYTFKRDSYAINVDYVVKNNSDKAWQGRLYGQIQRSPADLGGSRFLYTYMGGAISSPETLYEKISFDDIKDGSFTQENREGWANGWVAMLQHYFVSAWIPERDTVYNYYTKVLPTGNRHVLGLYGPEQTVAANQQHTFKMQFYTGPKDQKNLAELAPGLELTVDYGFLWFIAQPLFWLLDHIHDLVGNWGWSIILLTILIKLAFFHLSATSYKSMANMRRLQPRLVSLKERYADDKTRLNKAMMDLYKKEKINPLGGCLPILVQIPVFIALYWVLLESVELRQAPFILWLNNLSEPDPFFVLPLVMGATMLIQHHLNPAPVDPVQQKVMLMLPIVFTVFFAFFPAGLVLYWTVNNILSISQQWVITKKIAGNT
ncbi:membrane protein insertase YidC [Candidatus Marithrix sp. Canyon 246]|uniref:membrane protein insertase YidC n=1 Tax=Candidatus Marithrix sp. Canyon 246 TaxID=1827136 RepID=UPI000849F1DE|nr:membrane protein insertase YidC [Candidatus Marithrix sp. Canyon 246]